jgi:hypothetical protein
MPCVERLRQRLTDFYRGSRVPVDIDYGRFCDDETGKVQRWKIISVEMPSRYKLGKVLSGHPYFPATQPNVTTSL